MAESNNERDAESVLQPKQARKQRFTFSKPPIYTAEHKKLMHNVKQRKIILETRQLELKRLQQEWNQTAESTTTATVELEMSTATSKSIFSDLSRDLSTSEPNKSKIPVQYLFTFLPSLRARVLLRCEVMFVRQAAVKGKVN